MAALTFGGEIGRLQRQMARCHDLVVRRMTVVQALAFRSGERVLEIGCGGGLAVYETAQSVGPTGRVCAVDLSADQIAAASDRCAELPWVECRVADAVELPYEEAEFDAVYAIQVLEYVGDLDAALKEIRRVLRPGGRLGVLATNWSSLVWYSDRPARMERMLAAWSTHAPYPDLPAILAERLRQAGLQPLRQTPVPILNASHNANSFSYWAARLIAAFAVERRAATETEATDWLAELDELERRGASFFCSTPILTEAVRVS